MLSRCVQRILDDETDEGHVEEEELDTIEALAGVVRFGLNEPKPELGYVFAAWNEYYDERQVWFHATAGLSDTGSGLVNSARLEVRPESAGEVWRWTGVAQPALLALVRAWQPDYAVVWDFPLWQAQGVPAAHPFAGYVTYLSAPRARRLPTTLSTPAAPTGDGGAVLSLLPPGTAGWPDRQRAVSLGRELADAGVL